MEETRTTVAISGGGPAGVMLGLLLARAGVETTVLEKHADFLRDFRGDTVHPSTQLILAQLGLTGDFETIVCGRMPAIDFSTTETPLLHAELSTVARRHPFHEIALAPQWDLLDLLVRHARRYPTFHLCVQAETVEAVVEHGSVRGLRFRQDGETRELRAVLTVDAEGRGSVVRSAVGSPVVSIGSPIDVLWFRIDRREGDPASLRGTIGHGGAVVAVNRQDYWQVALVVRKGTDARIRAAGLPAFRSRVAEIAPWTEDRLESVHSWDDVKLLSVTIDRLRRWWGRGILAIGDAAHTMSPIGGVGINLAVADAVASANLLSGRLLQAQADPRRFDKTLDPAILRGVQRRRFASAAVVQAVQSAAQNRILAMTGSAGSLTPPPIVRMLLRSALTRIVPRLFAYGLVQERIR